jgi:hypothetical protein
MEHPVALQTRTQEVSTQCQSSENTHCFTYASMARRLPSINDPLHYGSLQGGLVCNLVFRRLSCYL